MACDVISSVRSHPAEYYFAAEQASGHHCRVDGLVLCAAWAADDVVLIRTVLALA